MTIGDYDTWLWFMVASDHGNLIGYLADGNIVNLLIMVTIR